MLEILFVWFLARRIGKIAEKKWREPIGYKIMLVVFWIAGEIGGFVLGAVATKHPSTAQIVITGYVSAFICAGIAFAIAASLPDRSLPEGSLPDASGAKWPEAPPGIGGGRQTDGAGAVAGAEYIGASAHLAAADQVGTEPVFQSEPEAVAAPEQDIQAQRSHAPLSGQTAPASQQTAPLSGQTALPPQASPPAGDDVAPVPSAGLAPPVNFCRMCGAHKAMGTNRCINCGGALQPGGGRVICDECLQAGTAPAYRFCGNCGQTIELA